MKELFETVLRESGFKIIRSPDVDDFGCAESRKLVARWNDEVLHFAIRKTFDRWANSTDFIVQAGTKEMIAEDVNKILNSVKEL